MPWVEDQRAHGYGTCARTVYTAIEGVAATCTDAHKLA